MKCVYLGCGCEAPESGAACSEYCRTMSDRFGRDPDTLNNVEEEGECRCGHEDCVHPKESRRSV
jgi:hypothetical protein